MTCRYSIDKEQNCVFVQYYGELGDREFEEQLSDLLSQPNYKKGMNILRDVRSTTLPLAWDFDWLKRMALRIAHNNESLGHDRLVAWVVGNSNDYMTIHKFSTLGQLNLYRADRRPFRDISEALEWLDIPNDYEIVYPDA